MKTGPQNLPWIEKYRPIHLDDMIDEGNKINILRGLIRNNELTHLMFYGPPGTGKTSLILACCREYYGDNFRQYVLELNASDERGIDTVRKQIPEFIKRSTPGKIKLVILDEADALTGDAQGALRRVIEQYSRQCRFCLICNNAYKIIPGLFSRCATIRFGKLPIANTVEKLSKIIQEESVNISQATVLFLLDHCADFRQILNIIQREHTLKFMLEGPDYSPINETNICDYLGIPTPEQFDLIVDSLISKRLNDNVNLLMEHHNKNRYSLTELVKLLSIWTAKQKWLTIGQKKKIIESLSSIDYRLKNSLGENDIQIYFLASIFMGLNKDAKPTTATATTTATTTTTATAADASASAPTTAN